MRNLENVATVVDHCLLHKGYPTNLTSQASNKYK